MKFSEVFGIARASDDDWFDPILSSDTKLFVDPFRVYVDKQGSWAHSHDYLISFFNTALKLLARSGFDKRSNHWKAATRLLVFPEPSEFCLGYSVGSPLGSGSGLGLQQGMLDGAVEAIRLGIESVEHFEELALFESGIGADRIGDIVCNVLKEQFINYTADVCRRHDIPMEPINVVHARWSHDYIRWANEVVTLPRNPYTTRGVLLTPQRFLRDLPTVDPLEFWDWAWTNENEDIRGEFNYDIARRVDARTIAALARRYPDLAKRYLRYLEDHPKPAYDVDSDPDLRVRWYDLGREVAEQSPLTFTPSVPQEFCAFIAEMLERFRHNIEQQDGWKILWANSRPRSEEIAQALFRSSMIHYCRANNIDLSGEANQGRGPVDFKFSQGWTSRALVEVKLTNNSRYWHGLQVQTPQYMRAEEIKCGFFLSIGFRDIDVTRERRNEVRAAAATTSEQLGITVTPVFIDARPKPSASRS